MSKIIQIKSVGGYENVLLYALCDDGRIWELNRLTGWVEIPLPVPKEGQNE